MNGPRSFHRKGARVPLRAIIAKVDDEMTHLSGPMAHDAPRSPPQRRIASLAELVNQRAAGVAPEARACPVCRHTGMRAATICGYCWNRLMPQLGGRRAAG